MDTSNATISLVLCTILNCSCFAKNGRVTDVLNVLETKRNTTDVPVNGGNISSVRSEGGNVSVDCLRCLCLRLSDCRPRPCVMVNKRIRCGYFMITKEVWVDANVTDSDWRTCPMDFTCAVQCVQNYMAKYAKRNDCLLQCEGYSRELYDGPKGCNDPRTIPFWESVQRVPGCKGVM